MTLQKSLAEFLAPLCIDSEYVTKLPKLSLDPKDKCGSNRAFTNNVTIEVCPIRQKAAKATIEGNGKQ